MKKYVHWLKINGCTSDEQKQYAIVADYLKKYTNAKATIYHCEFHLFHRIVKLECEQNWNDLDMNVNSFSSRLRRLVRKPANIFRPKPFYVPEYLAQR